MLSKRSLCKHVTLSKQQTYCLALSFTITQEQPIGVNAELWRFGMRSGRKTSHTKLACWHLYMSYRPTIIALAVETHATHCHQDVQQSACTTQTASSAQTESNGCTLTSKRHRWPRLLSLGLQWRRRLCRWLLSESTCF